MPRRNILCVSLGCGARNVVEYLVNNGWNVAEASTLAAAGRLQALQHFGVSLLLMAGAPPTPPGALRACVRTSRGSEWVALCDNLALESTEFRDLILGDFFGHQTLPLDGPALATLLLHAGQRAELRHQHTTTQTLTSQVQGMVGESPALQHLRQQIRKVAATTAPVLIGGESGSGKELAAQAIHHTSARSEGPFVAINCGAIAPSLIHAELFGHERGAFTGASTQHGGLIEAAHRGTLFLDEIADLPLDLQTNLLRFLQEKTINRLGSVRSLHVDVRVLAASHTDLAAAVAQGRFREDLFYRLNVFPIEMPALRERADDLPDLVMTIAAQLSRTGRGEVRFANETLQALRLYAWPGNVRELTNLVERLAVLHPGGLVRVADLPKRYQPEHLDAVATEAAAVPAQPAAAAPSMATAVTPTTIAAAAVVPADRLPEAGIDLREHIAQIELNLIRDALDRAGGVVAHAAQLLGLRRTTLVEKLRKYGVEREDVALATEN